MTSYQGRGSLAKSRSQFGRTAHDTSHLPEAWPLLTNDKQIIRMPKIHMPPNASDIFQLICAKAVCSAAARWNLLFLLSRRSI